MRLLAQTVFKYAFNYTIWSTLRTIRLNKCIWLEACSQVSKDTFYPMLVAMPLAARKA